MIKIKTDRPPNLFLSLSIVGHANTAEAGRDLVCASVSILAYTLAQCVKDYALDDKLQDAPIINLESGNSLIVCRPKEEYKSEVENAFKVINTGLDLLMANYPKNVGKDE